jgi:hypothetical protein
MTGLTSPQRRRLSEVVAEGFKRYTEKYGDRRHVGALTDSEDENRNLILSCGAKFGVILHGRSDWLADLPDLQEDLFNLIEGGCPILDIIDLMFACTKGRSLAIPDRLEEIGLQEPSLGLLRQICQLASEKISALNQSGAGPLSFLSELVPDLAEDDRVRLEHDIQRLPDLIGLFGDLLDIHPPSSAVNRGMNASLRNCEVVLFRMLLDRFTLGFPALSRLLRAMRQARSLAFPEKPIRGIATRRVVLSEQSKSAERSDERDPFGERALQRRLNRFFREPENGKWHFLMQFWMLRYLSAEFSAQRASGAIFFSVLEQLTAPHHPPA